MLEYLVVAVAALAVAALTLFSGFGLGTLLVPVMALFFPIEVAIAATAVVHFANNLFKIALVGRTADWHVVAVFALPGALAALIGASLLTLVSEVPPIATYELVGTAHEIGPVGVVIGVVIIVFALLDILPRFQDLAFDRKYLPVGGLLSGFFGGLSGNQGALRSAFLIKSGLDKEAYVGTAAVASTIVDVSRLLVYGLAIFTVGLADPRGDLTGLVAAAMAAAFVGSFVGSRLVKKVTLRTVQLMVGLLLIAIGTALVTGLV
mgnify:CR=1 FL=1